MTWLRSDQSWGAGISQVQKRLSGKFTAAPHAFKLWSPWWPVACQYSCFKYLVKEFCCAHPRGAVGDAVKLEEVQEILTGWHLTQLHNMIYDLWHVNLTLCSTANSGRTRTHTHAHVLWCGFIRLHPCIKASHLENANKYIVPAAAAAAGLQEQLCLRLRR